MVGRRKGKASPNTQSIETLRQRRCPAPPTSEEAPLRVPLRISLRRPNMGAQNRRLGGGGAILECLHPPRSRLGATLQAKDGARSSRDRLQISNGYDTPVSRSVADRKLAIPPRQSASGLQG